MNSWEEIESQPEFGVLNPEDKKSLHDAWKDSVLSAALEADPDQIDSDGVHRFVATAEARSRSLAEGKPFDEATALKEYQRSVAERTAAQNQVLADYDEYEMEQGKLRDAESSKAASLGGFGVPNVFLPAEIDAPVREAQQRLDAVASRFTPEMLEQAKAAREAIRGERPVAQLGTDLYTDPALTLDKEEYRKAVAESGASMEAKAKAIADFSKKRKAFAQAAAATLQAAGESPIPGVLDFPTWESRLPREQYLQPPEEKALQYMREMKGRDGFRKVVSAIATGIMQGGVDIASQGIGVAALATQDPKLAAKAAEVSKAAETLGEVQKLEGDLTATGATTAGGMARLGTSMAPAIAGSALTGGGLPAASLLAGAQTTGAQFPSTFSALKEQGKSDEEALRAATGSSLMAGAVTTALTAMGGATGVEALVRQGGKEFAKREIVKRIATGALKEVPEEVLDEAASQIIEAQTVTPDKPVAQVVDEFMATVPDLALQVALLGAGAETFKAITERGGRPQEAGPQPVTPAPDTDFARRAAMEGATEFRDTTAGVPVVVEGVTIATIPPGSDLSPDDVAAFAAEPDMLKTLARSGQITLPEIVKPVEGVDPALTDEMNQNIAAGAIDAPATVKALEEAQARYEAEMLAQERQAAEQRADAAQVPISQQPSPNSSPRAAESVEPIPQRREGESRSDFIDRRDTWEENYGSMRKGGRTHNDDGTPYRPTIFDETAEQVMAARMSMSGEEALDAIGDQHETTIAASLKSLLDAGWTWDAAKRRMVPPAGVDPNEKPLDAILRLQGKEGEAKTTAQDEVKRSALPNKQSSLEAALGLPAGTLQKPQPTRTDETARPGPEESLRQENPPGGGGRTETEDAAGADAGSPAATPTPTEESVKLGLTPDESGATGAGMKEEIQQTPERAISKPPKVGNVGAIPTPEEAARWEAVDAFTNPYVASLSGEDLDAFGAAVGSKRNGVGDEAYRAKILGNTHPDDLLDAIPDVAAPQPITPTGEEPTDSLPADQPTSGDVGAQPTVTTATETPSNRAKVAGGSQGVQTEPAEGSISAVTTATVPPAATESTGEVQPAKVLSRGKPRESIVFKSPVRTPLGDVIGYSWSSQLVEDVDKDGEPILRRVSNWEEAANNAETGRDIVHRFLIRKPDGSVSEVSLESTLGKMTPAGKKTIKSVISAAKRLPFMRAELAELQDLQKRSDEDYQRTQKLTPDSTKLELRAPDFEVRKKAGDKVAYLDDVFLGYVSANDLNTKGELANKARFIYENAWKWRDAQRKVRITSAQADRIKSLARSVKKAEELLKKENVEVAKVTADEQSSSLAETGPPVREMKSPSVTTDQPASTSYEEPTTQRRQQGGADVVGIPSGSTGEASTSKRPSLGNTGKQIIEAWRSLQGVQVAPGETVVGWDVNGGGTYAFINDRLVKLRRNDKGFETTYTEATDNDWQDVSDALDRGALQVEVRKITGLGGYQKADAGKTVRVLHQATGRPLQEFLDTPEGAAYEARMQKAVAERGPKEASKNPAENLVSFTAANGQKLVGEVQSVTGNKATVAYQWNGKTKTQVVPVSQLGSPVASVATPPKYLYNQEQNTRKLGKHFPTSLGVHANHDFRKSFASMAEDTSLSQIYRMVAKVLAKMPEFKGIDLHLVADENIKYAGEYSWNNGKPSIAINLRYLGRGKVDALGSILHEALHHVTLAKVRNPQGAYENEVVGKLDAIREKVIEYAESKGLARALDYELGSLEEFITAIFTRPDFQALLASIPDSAAPGVAVGKFRSILSEIFRRIAELVTGKPVLRGSALEQAMTTSLALFNTPFRGIETGGLEALNAARSTRQASPESIRHAELEAKHNAGTITPEETAEAQALVDEAAKAAGGVEVWHGGDIEGFNIDVNRRERGAVSERRAGTFFASSSKDVARTYPGKTNRLFFFLRNPFRISTPSLRPAQWTGETAVRTSKGVESRKSSLSIGEAIDRAKANGYDGVVYGNLLDLGRNQWGIPFVGDTHVAFSPEQIKSADPFTGVPLDQRFDKTSNDTRFSKAEGDAKGKGLKALFPQTGDKAAKPSALAEQWWAATTRQEARAILEPASLEELKAIAVRMDENPNQPKAKLIDRLVQITGVYADAVGIRGADAVGPRGPMPDYTGQTAAAQQRMREQKAARAQQPKERGLPKAKPRTPEEFARDMAALMARPASETKPINLSAAYQKATVGKSSRWVTIKEVYEQAKADNPSLTPETFMAQIEQQNEAGGVMISPVENVSTVEAARPFVVGNAGVEMIVPSGTAASRIDEETDAEYLAAVEAGDMEKTQAMVDAAAWDSGYQKLVVHQTHQTGIREFDRSRGGTGVYEWDNIGIWTTTEDTPTVYGPVKMRLFGRMENPKRYRDLDAYDEMLREYFRVAYREVLFALNSTEVESDQLVPLFRKEIARLAKEDGIEGSAQSKKYQAWLKSRFPGAEGFRQYLKTQGYDGIQIDGAFWDGEIQTVRVFLEPNQIKSADPVTYDDAGNVIPLSQRFNPESPSIAYSRVDEGEPPIDIGGVAEPADGGGTQLFQKDPTAIGSTYTIPADITLQERRSQEETLSKARKIIAEEVQKDEKGGRAVALERFKIDTSLPPEVRAAGTGLIAQQADLLANLEREAVAQQGLDRLAEEAGNVSGIISSDFDHWRNLQLAANLDIDKMAEEAGRTLNIFNVFRRLTPEGFLRRMKRQYNATVQESMAQNFDIPPGEVEAEIMRLWRMMREAGATARGEAIAAALKAFMPRRVNARKIIESLFPQAGTRQRMSKGGEALVRNFFQMMAGPRDQKGPLAEFDESIQNALSGMLRKVMEAKGLVAKNQSNQATDIDKLVRSVSADELRFDKIAAADEAMQQELDAIEDPERRATLRQAWEEATAKMYTNIASDATVRRAINAELKGMNVDWRKMFDSNQKPDAIKAKVVDAVMTKIEGLLTNAADPTVRQNLNMLRDEVEAAFDFIAANKRTEWLAYREGIEARRRVAEHRAAFMEALRNQGVAEDALLRISKKLLAGPLPQKPDQNPVSALVGEHMKGEVPNFVDKLVALDVDRATAEQLDTAAKALRADIAEVEKLKAAERAVKKLMDSLKPKPRAPREKIEKALKALFTAAETGALDSQEFFDALGEALGHPPLTAEQQAKIKKLTREINALPKGAARVDKQQELDEELALWKGIAARDVLLSAWYANILSGISTQGIGLFGNLVNFIPRSLFLAATNPRSAKAYFQGALGEGLKTGLREAAAALKGRGLYKVSKYGDKNMVSALELLRKKGPATLPEWIAYIASGGTRLRYVFRIMQAIDALAWNTAREGQAYLAAHRALLNQQRADGVKRTPEEFYRALIDNLGGDAKQIEEDMRTARETLIALGQTPDLLTVDRMAREARNARRSSTATKLSNRFADRIVMQQDPEGIGDLISSVITVIQKKGNFMGVPFGQLLIPFNKIVANLFEQSLDYTPVGALRSYFGGHLTDLTPAIWRGKVQFKDKSVQFDAVERAERMAASVTGTLAASVMFALASLFKDEPDEDVPFMLYGFGPESKNKRDQMPKGWTPYSAKIGDTYIKFSEMPFGVMFAAAGNALDAMRYKNMDKKSSAERLAYVLKTSAKGFTEQGVLSSFDTALEVLTFQASDKKFTDVPVNIAKGMVPAQGMLRDMSVLFDPVKIKDDTISAALLRDFPVVRRIGTRPALNVFGEPVTFDGRIPFVRRIATVREEHAAADYLGRNRLSVPGMAQTIVVGQYLPKDMRDRIQRRALETSAMENGVFTVEQDYNFRKRAGELTKAAVENLMKQVPTITSDKQRENVQKLINKKVEIARRRAMLEAVPAQ